MFVALAGAGCKNAISPPPMPAASAASLPASVPVSTASSTTPTSYQAAKYDPLHFKPAIEKATDQQCLACHAEVLKPSVRQTSLAGLKASDVKAWYEQLSTYQGDQETFHRRHLVMPYAKQVMNLHCNTCHQGSDPRDQASGSSATAQSDVTLRKTVVPEETCLKCHGQMNWPVMGLPGPWPQNKALFQNNCVRACHFIQRTVRHQVNYLNARGIEELAVKPNGGDVCYGCHGGRAWYRVIYPLPRHQWPNMPTETPSWAKNRPTQSEARFLVGVGPLQAVSPLEAQGIVPDEGASGAAPAASSPGEKK
ncbi:MAG: hypothetical protein LBH31_02345 [Burkholderiaceae bacterium]|nr:hypothetical protein [Burkholderiaceae bacterium]